jgi:hypothetical protein
MPQIVPFVAVFQMEANRVDHHPYPLAAKHARKVPPRCDVPYLSHLVCEIRCVVSTVERSVAFGVGIDVDAEQGSYAGAGHSNSTQGPPTS